MVEIPKKPCTWGKNDVQTAPESGQLAGRTGDVRRDHTEQREPVGEAGKKIPWGKMKKICRAVFRQDRKLGMQFRGGVGIADHQGKVSVFG